MSSDISKNRNDKLNVHQHGESESMSNWDVAVVLNRLRGVDAL